MGREKIVALTFCSILSLVLLLAAGAPDHPSTAALESITEAKLKSDLYFLASDEMRGRNINSVYNEITSRYLAHRFELMGLEAFGNDGYFQYFSLVQPKLSASNRLIFQRSSLSTTAILEEDFFPSTQSASGKVSARVVFAGYGITAPEYDYDDYEHLDAEGAIVMAMNHEPGERDPGSVFDGAVNSDYSRELYKILNAQEHGAVAVVFISDELNHRRTSEFSRRARRVWPEDPSRGSYSLKLWTDRIRIPAVHVSREIAGLWMEAAGTSVSKVQAAIDEDHKPHSLSLSDISALIETALTREETRVRNVLAYLPGSHPSLRDELVIVSAHFDHVGARNGRIFNGADDDASGTVGLLEIAEAYALGSARPDRSVLFAAWNAEEQGLLGSRYYVERPPVPLTKTAAVFQMDMIGRNEEIPDPRNPRFRGLEKQTAEENVNSVNILGYSRSNDLRTLAAENNRRIGLDLKFRYDNNRSNLLRRSDNWPFLTMGVPALFFHTGLHPDYHQPTDVPDRINYSKMEKVVRLVFLCSWSTANGSTRPRLNSPRGRP